MDKFITNGGVNIHYIIINKECHKIPLIMIPGAINSADEIYTDINSYTYEYCIIISLRGRGKSSTPLSGYTLKDYISDIEAVVEAEKLTNFFMFGHSVGGAICLKYSILHREQVKGVIIGDYLPIFPKFTESWMNLIGTFSSSIDKKALLPIVRESEKEDLTSFLDKNEIPICLLLSDSKKSVVKNSHIERLKQLKFLERMEVVKNSDHDLLHSNTSETLYMIFNFIKSKYK